jgi:hypothetical protein
MANIEALEQATAMINEPENNLSSSIGISGENQGVAICSDVDAVAWRPTVVLRWRKDGPYQATLEQLWESRSLTTITQEWRPVPIVEEGI